MAIQIKTVDQLARVTCALLDKKGALPIDDIEEFSREMFRQFAAQPLAARAVILASIEEKESEAGK